MALHRPWRHRPEQRVQQAGRVLRVRLEPVLPDAHLDAGAGRVTPELLGQALAADQCNAVGTLLQRALPATSQRPAAMRPKPSGGPVASPDAVHGASVLSRPVPVASASGNWAVRRGPRPPWLAVRNEH